MTQKKLLNLYALTAILLFPIINSAQTVYATENKTDETELVLNDETAKETKVNTTLSTTMASGFESNTANTNDQETGTSTDDTTEDSSATTSTEATDSSQIDTQTSSSDEKKAETFKLDVWKDFPYITVMKGDKLTADMFKDVITAFHDLDITELRFINGEPDTTKVGRHAALIEISTADGQTAQGEFGYGVSDSVPTLKIKNVEYDIEKRQLSFTSEPDSLTYVTADTEPVTWQGMTDNKGFYTNTFSSTPTTIDIFVADGKGSYSEVFHLKIPKDDKANKVPLYKIGFDKETNLLSGQTLPGISIKVFTEDGPVTSPEVNAQGDNFISDASDGTFSIQLAKTYETIRIELTDHDGQTSTYYLGSDDNDSETSKEIAKNAKKLPQTGETSKIIFSVLGGIVVVGAITFMVIRKRKQS